VNGGDEEGITICGTKMLVKVVWSIIDDWFMSRCLSIM
jgi:hypothetical protein